MNEKIFDGKAKQYSSNRPTYPIEVIEILQTECNLNPESVVADVGAGTGIFTRLIAKNCKKVFEVEPGADMRGEIEHDCPKNVTPLAAAAEKTTLQDKSVDIVTAAQAFHWFDKPKAKTEFERILKPNGFVALVWNNRNKTTPFEIAYEAISDRYRSGYLRANDNRDSEEDKLAFFKNGVYKKFYFPNSQTLSLEQCLGRMLSLSYMPKEEDSGFAKIRSEIEALFAKYSAGGKITLSMQTEIYIGKI